MQIKNRLLILLYRIILVMAAGTGLWYGLGLNHGVCDLGRLVFYTFLSNLLCFLFFTAATIYTAVLVKTQGCKGDATLWPRLKGGLTVIISVTLLVYWLVLSSHITSPPYSPFTPKNLLLHYITPIMVIGDWFLFDRKDTYKRLDPILCLIGPLIYLTFILIRAPLYGNIGKTGSPYPYFFINLNVLSPLRFMLYVSAIAAFFVCLGYVFMFIAKICTLKNRRGRN